jgi:hypothetical protein
VRPPEKAEGPAANRTPRTAIKVNQIDDSTPGFWRLATTGKVRPSVREPDVSHYTCTQSCCERVTA